uniref:Cytochrome b6-f complex subunit 7 n=2 Tax=Membranoptera TaxID=158697 RepID=A0A1L1YA39_9FLOR|nr:cytochrome b6-f complex subunit 7 [Membranoptera weeksiae]YP_009332909.1 cytochrome b6-f complex subunit VII [Membranoptera tenuis]AHZ94703.1 cytochrome b6-f complex subunit 7 [Membranoptera weeksiae]AKL79165.1 cytochrome b6-f complex subunit VII [Membranoptera tenuis]
MFYEITTTAVISCILIIVGLALGFLLLRIQGE